MITPAMDCGDTSPLCPRATRRASRTLDQATDRLLDNCLTLPSYGRIYDTT